MTINQKLLEEINNFQDNYIAEIDPDHIVYDLRIEIKKQNSMFGARDNIEIYVNDQSNLEKLWSNVYPVFLNYYEKFKITLFKKFPSLGYSSWDGEVIFYTKLWNTYKSKLFDSQSLSFIELGSSEEGGHYYFDLYNQNNVNVSFEKENNKYGRVKIIMLEWDNNSDSSDDEIIEIE